MKQYGLKEADIVKRLEENQKQLKEAAEKDVKVFLILHRIAELEKIEAQKGENISVKVMELLFKEAKWEEAK